MEITFFTPVYDTAARLKQCIFVSSTETKRQSFINALQFHRLTSIENLNFGVQRSPE